MALPKIYDYLEHQWHNNTTPSINEDELNAISFGLSEVDDRVIDITGTLMEDVPRIIEDMAILGPAVENIDANVARAEGAADDAEDEALKSEGYAAGTQDGVEVTSGEYYQNNAKYYADIANPPIENTVDFADIITISDAINKAAKDVRLKVEAVQDLHGYTKPWVGGAGKNKLPNNAITKVENGVTFTVNSDGSITVSTASEGATANTNLMFNFDLKAGSYVLKSGVNTSAWSKSCLYIYKENLVDVADYQGGAFTLASDTVGIACTLRVASGCVISTPITYYPMITLATDSDPTYEPYTNICPITGHSEAIVYRDGLNIWDEQTESGGYSSSGSPYSDADLIRSKNYIPVKAGVYYFSANTSGIRVCGYDSNENFIAVCPVSNNTFTIVDGMSFIRFHVNKNVGNICINLSNPSKNGQYEPYNGSIYGIVFGETYYGGTLDVTSGVLTLTHKALDMGTQTYVSAGNDGYTLGVSDIKTVSSYSDSELICSALFNDYNSKPSMPHGSMRYDGTNSPYLYFKYMGLSSAAEFATAMTGQTLVYPLATPQTIQLTPTQVYLLYGYNTLFGDCGDISLTYDASGIIHIEESKLDTETLKTIAAASSDFADFKARIAAL